MEGINYPAIVAAAVSTFAIGGIWYSQLMFHKAWAATNALSDADSRAARGACLARCSYLPS